MNKTEFMAMIAASNGLRRETFEHEHQGMFDVTAMRAWAVQARLEKFSVAISDVLDMIRTTRIVDEQRILDLPEASWRDDPAMIVLYEDGPRIEHLMIDGTHRVLRRHLEGESLFYTYIVPEKYIIRPDMRHWVQGAELGVTWGVDVSTLKESNGN